MPEDLPVHVAPLLTIAIPTYNRASFLAENLAQIGAELRGVAPGLIEVVVSDNCSLDDTPGVVAQAIADGLPIHSVRNETNVGWARNFAQAYDLARGTYVLLLGDDDLFIDGALVLLLSRLADRRYGAVCLRPYGYDVDWRAEYPGGEGRERLFTDPNEFLVAISRFMTLTSACVCNKSLLRDVDSRAYVGGDLAAFQFVLRAALAGRENLYLDRYLIASKRQNSASYEFASIFVDELWRIVDAHVAHGLSRDAVRRIERDKLLSYYPFYLLDLRLSGRGDLQRTYDRFASRFAGRRLFHWWLVPIIRWPRPLAILWGGATTFIGRVLGGEFRRGVRFASSRLVRALRGTRPAGAA